MFRGHDCGLSVSQYSSYCSDRFNGNIPNFSSFLICRRSEISQNGGSQGWVGRENGVS